MSECVLVINPSVFWLDCNYLSAHQITPVISCERFVWSNARRNFDVCTKKIRTDTYITISLFWHVLFSYSPEENNFEMARECSLKWGLMIWHALRKAEVVHSLFFSLTRSLSCTSGSSHTNLKLVVTCNFWKATFRRTSGTSWKI